MRPVGVVMQIKDSIEQLTYLRTAMEANKLKLMFASLDDLGSVPRKINKPVFDVVLEVWNSGNKFGKIPPASLDVPEPVKPANYETDTSAKIHYLLQLKAAQILTVLLWYAHPFPLSDLV